MPPSLHIETSLADPMRDINQALYAELAMKGVPSDLVVLPGSTSSPS